VRGIGVWGVRRRVGHEFTSVLAARLTKARRRRSAHAVRVGLALALAARNSEAASDDGSVSALIPSACGQPPVVDALKPVRFSWSIQVRSAVW
jgi:hypothetical protein